MIVGTLVGGGNPHDGGGGKNPKTMICVYSFQIYNGLIDVNPVIQKPWACDWGWGRRRSDPSVIHHQLDTKINQLKTVDLFSP